MPRFIPFLGAVVAAVLLGACGLPAGLNQGDIAFMGTLPSSVATQLPTLMMKRLPATEAQVYDYSLLPK